MTKSKRTAIFKTAKVNCRSYLSTFSQWGLRLTLRCLTDGPISKLYIMLNVMSRAVPHHCSSDFTFSLGGRYIKVKENEDYEICVVSPWMKHAHVQNCGHSLWRHNCLQGTEAASPRYDVHDCMHCLCASGTWIRNFYRDPFQKEVIKP